MKYEQILNIKMANEKKNVYYKIQRGENLKK